jgi:Putative beta-barrel porin 2
VKKILVGFLMTNCMVFFCSGKVLREDVVAYSLDYHELKEKENSQQEIITQGVSQIKKEKEEKKIASWDKKKKKINELLKNVLVTLEFKTTYNDNVFQEKNAKSDIINIISVNANYISKQSQQKQGKTDFFLDFQGDGLGYTTAKASDTAGTNIRAGLNHRLTDKYGALLEYGFTKRQMATSSTSSSASGSEKTTDNFVNTFGGTFTAAWGRFPWSLAYDHSESKYEKEFNSSDDTENTLTITPAFKISPKTEVFCQYVSGDIEYPERESGDYSYTQYSVGARGKLAPKITGIAKVGRGTYDYDDDGTTKETEELEARLIYKLSKRFLLSGIAGNTISASTYGDNDSSKKSYIGFTGRYFPPFNKKLTLQGSANLTTIKLEDTKREDETLALKLAAKYGLNKRTELTLAYEHRTRESTDIGKEYEQNKMTLAGTWEF